MTTSRATNHVQRGTAKGVSNNERLTPWSLRDHPTALLIGVVGVLAILVVLGWLTVRIGTIWVRAYTHRQVHVDE